jgi:hypothetical protein
MLLLPVVHHPLYSAPQLAPGHRFPMAVFQRIADLLLETTTIVPAQVHIPPSLPCHSTLELVHTPEYVSAFCSGQLDAAAMRRIGFGEVTRTKTLIDRTKAEVAGTLRTAELALQHGLAVNTAGGTHHAFADYGSGFCILNDLAITAESLLSRNACNRILILMFLQRDIVGYTVLHHNCGMHTSWGVVRWLHHLYNFVNFYIIILILSYLELLCTYTSNERENKSKVIVIVS